MATKLDWKRPYGEVCGSVDEAPGARYVQDGRYYGPKGEEVGSMPKVEVAPPPAPEPEPEVPLSDDVGSL